jgi:hypothetical protein
MASLATSIVKAAPSPTLNPERAFEIDNAKGREGLALRIARLVGNMSTWRFF